MSYILDALRRADAERQRGAVPGLHAQAAPTPAALGVEQRRAVPLAWVLAGGGLLLAIALLLWWTGRERVAVAPVAPTPPAAAPAPALPATNPIGPPIARPVTPTIAPVPVPTGSAPAVPAPVRAARPASPPLAAPASAATPVAPAASAAARVPLLAELPEALRRQLPPLALGGSMYSEQAERRLVIVNGQVAHEGDEPAAGLTVRRIGLRSVVFEFHGQLFELAL